MPKWTEEQSQAINSSGKNIIVSAGAGSGKTAVLSERVLRIVKSGIDIDRLLILTFTKAAAYEMMLRIRKKIKKEGLLDQVEKIDKAYITTFDSFALSIVRKYHDVLNISPNISIIDNATMYLVKKEKLELIFNNLYEEENPTFQKLITCFCTKDDKNIKDWILNISNKLDLKVDKEDYLNTYLDAFFDNKKIDNDINTYFNYIKSETKKIYPLLSTLELELDGDYCYSIREIIDNIEESESYDILVTKLDYKLSNLPRGSSEEAKKTKQEISKMLDKIKKLCNYNDSAEIKESILNTHDLVKIIIEIITRLDNEVNKYKSEYNTYEFIDISKFAIKIVKEHEEIKEELKNYFYEIMIDEYQDTNDLQEIFISMIENNNVYMVGDIKQSIYRFRNANPNIFKKKYNDYANGILGLKIDLNKNFRSRGEVLDDINQIFNLIMNDELGGAQYKETHQMVFGNNTYIEEGKTSQSYKTEIYNYTYEKNSIFTKDEIEAFIVAEDIKKKVDEHYQIFDKDTLLLHDAKYSDFVILMDRSSKFDLYKKILEYYKIPSTILKEENILNHIEIYLIKNLLNLYIKIVNKEFDESFKYSFLSIGRSYLFRLTDQELFDYITNNKYFDSVIIKKITKITSNSKQNTLSDIVRSLIDEFDFYEKAFTVGNIDFVINDLEYILNLATNLETLDYTPESFHDYLQSVMTSGLKIELPQGVEEKNSVKIMTIHKSKGLEYPICYYTGLANKFNVRDLKEKIISSEDYGIIIPSFLNGEKETIYKSLYKEQFYQEEISEKIRLLYVALTRCKEKMIMVTNLDEDEVEDIVVDNQVKLKYRSFREILKSIAYPLKDFIKEIDLSKVNITMNYKKKLSSEITEFINNKKTSTITIPELSLNLEEKITNQYSKHNTKILTMESKKNMTYGIKVHEAFEMIDFKNPNYDELELDDFIKNKITKFLNNPVLKNKNAAKIYKEFQFIDDSDTIGIIDCMLVYQDHIDIIDYKLKDITDKAYLKQLQGYQKYIFSRTKKKTNIYLYSIINEEMIQL